MDVFRSISLGVLAMSIGLEPRLSVRPLGDVAVIALPTSLRTEARNGYDDGRSVRLTYAFSSTYFWASFGSITTYRQLVIVSVMAPDATESEYGEVPRRLNLGYERRAVVSRGALGSGQLTVTTGIYSGGSLAEPALEFVYIDRSRRLQLAWHAWRW